MTFDIDIVFNGVIGACFFAIACCVFYAGTTSPELKRLEGLKAEAERNGGIFSHNLDAALHRVKADQQFFRYVGWVFGSFIGACGIARLSRPFGYMLGLDQWHRVELINVTDGFTATISLAAAIAIVAINIKVRRLGRRRAEAL